MEIIKYCLNNSRQTGGKMHLIMCTLKQWSQCFVLASAVLHIDAVILSWTLADDTQPFARLHV